MNTLQAQKYFNQMGMVYQHFPAFFYPFQVQQQTQNVNRNFTILDKVIHFRYKQVEEVESSSFETRLEPSIILRSASQLPKKVNRTIETAKSNMKKKATERKMTQKQSRNVASNLLRIFLKHVIQLKFYDAAIDKMIKRCDMGCTSAEFHQWLGTFNINYKNYIRFTEIKRVLHDSQNKEMQAIFRMLLKQYSIGVGVRHCLTSRRIEKTSIPMHLQGLRQLLQQIFAE